MSPIAVSSTGLAPRARVIPHSHTCSIRWGHGFRRGRLGISDAAGPTPGTPAAGQQGVDVPGARRTGRPTRGNRLRPGSGAAPRAQAAGAHPRHQTPHHHRRPDPAPQPDGRSTAAAQATGRGAGRRDRNSGRRPHPSRARSTTAPTGTRIATIDQPTPRTSPAHPTTNYSPTVTGQPKPTTAAWPGPTATPHPASTTPTTRTNSCAATPAHHQDGPTSD